MYFYGKITFLSKCKKLLKIKIVLTKKKFSVYDKNV